MKKIIAAVLLMGALSVPTLAQARGHGGHGHGHHGYHHHSGHHRHYGG